MWTIKRKKYLVDKKFQLKFVFFLILSLVLLYTFTLLTVVFAPYILALSSDLPMEQRAEAAQTLLALHKNIWPGVGVVIVLFGVFSIYVTHRIAGPLFRIKRALHEIGGGNLATRISLRKTDELGDLAETVNDMTDGLRSSIAGLSEKHQDLISLQRALDASLKAEHVDVGGVTSILRKSEERAKEMGEILERFNTRVE